jgi:hypothetical protein
LDLRPDAGGKTVELGCQPLLEGRGPVLTQDAHRLEDLGGVGDAGAAVAQHLVEVRDVDQLALAVVGQQHDQAAVQGTPHNGVEAAGFGHDVGQMQRPGQPRVVGGWTAAQVDTTVAVAAANVVEQRGCDQPAPGRTTAGGGGLGGRPLTP